MVGRVARLAVLGVVLLALPLAGCNEDEAAPDKRITGLSNFQSFIRNTGGLKSLNTYIKRRPEILSEESIGVLYDGARTEGEVMRFKDKQVAKAMLPALKESGRATGRGR